MALSKGCVLGLGVVLPNDSNLEASILVASPMQNKENQEQDEGKLFFDGYYWTSIVSYQRRTRFYKLLFSKERNRSCTSA